MAVEPRQGWPLQPGTTGFNSAASRDITGSAQQITGLVVSDILAGHYATLPNDFSGCPLRQSTGVIRKYMKHCCRQLRLCSLKARIARAENITHQHRLGLSADSGSGLFLDWHFPRHHRQYPVACPFSTPLPAAICASGSISARDEFGQVGDSFNEMADGFSALLKASRENEARLQDMSAHLEERVKERTIELERVHRESEVLLRRNRALMQTSMDGIHVMDMQGNILTANDAFCRMLGYTGGGVRP